MNTDDKRRAVLANTRSREVETSHTSPIRPPTRGLVRITKTVDVYLEHYANRLGPDATQSLVEALCGLSEAVQFIKRGM